MSSIVQATGAVAITAGAALIAIPAGLIVGGILLILIGIGMER
jgi:hypothetical protein